MFSMGESMSFVQRLVTGAAVQTADRLEGNIHAVVEHPFERVRSGLGDVHHWSLLRSSPDDAHAWRLRKRAIAWVAGPALLLAALALAWRYTPLAQFATAKHVSALAHRAAHARWTPLAVIVAYPVAAVVMFPRPLITLFAVIAFGPLVGFLYAMLGVFTSASATSYAGTALPKETVERFVSDRLRAVRAIVEKRGLVAMFAISIVPVAPFIAVGSAAGAMRVRFRHYIAGVLLGHVPGTLTTSILGGQLKFVLEGRSGVNHGLLAGAAVFLVVTIVAVRAWFQRQCRTIQRESDGSSTPLPS